MNNPSEPKQTISLYGKYARRLLYSSLVVVTIPHLLFLIMTELLGWVGIMLISAGIFAGSALFLTGLIFLVIGLIKKQIIYKWTVWAYFFVIVALLILWWSTSYNAKKSEEYWRQYYEAENQQIKAEELLQNLNR